jgi:hypothetical protein
LDEIEKDGLKLAVEKAENHMKDFKKLSANSEIPKPVTEKPEAKV